MTIFCQIIRRLLKASVDFHRGMLYIYERNEEQLRIYGRNIDTEEGSEWKTMEIH